MVPSLLANGTFYWLNRYSPSDPCWEKLIPGLTGMQVNHGVLFRSYSHLVRGDGIVSERNEAPMVIRDEPLPMARVRLVAPPEWNQPLAHVLPVDTRQPSVRIIRGKRQTIAIPDPGSSPPTVTLEPDEIIELIHAK